MTFEPIEHEPDDYETTQETSAGETGGREMMSDERLAEIRAHHDEYGFVGATDVDSIVAELLAEVERLNEVLHANTVIRNAAESTGRVYKQLAARLREDRDQARAELGELRERIGKECVEWGIEHPFEDRRTWPTEDETRRCSQHLRRFDSEWQIVSRVVGEWKAAGDA